MKSSKYLKAAAFPLLTAAALFFSGCESSGPSSSIQPAVTDQGPQKDLRFVRLNKNATSLMKTTVASKHISAQYGGYIELEHESGDLEVEIELRILPGALNEDTEIKITVNDDQFLGEVDVVFHPHGIVFNQPALLSIEAEGLELDGMDLEALGIFYNNEESGEWEEMECDDFEVEYDYEDGWEIEVENARLPHFSRYGIAAD